MENKSQTLKYDKNKKGVISARIDEKYILAFELISKKNENTTISNLLKDIVIGFVKHNIEDGITINSKIALEIAEKYLASSKEELEQYDNLKNSPDNIHTRIGRLNWELNNRKLDKKEIPLCVIFKDAINYESTEIVKKYNNEFQQYFEIDRELIEGFKLNVVDIDDIELLSSSEKLYEILTHWRLEKSKELKIPAYMIFKNDTLKVISNKRPKTKTELLNINGIGDKKLSEYGNDLIQILDTYYKETNKDSQYTSILDNLKIENLLIPLSKNEEWLLEKHFIPKCNITMFSEDEKDILEEYGVWLSALYENKIKELNEEQKKFIYIVNKKNIDICENDYEKTFVKYLLRVDMENNTDWDRINSVETTIRDNFFDRKDLEKIYPHKKGK